MLKITSKLAAAVLMVSAAALIGSASSAMAAANASPSHRVQYERLSAGGSQFFNYDGDRVRQPNNGVAGQPYATNRDWPVTMIFADNASINKIKNRLDLLGYPRAGGAQYEGYKVSSNGFRHFDSDKGKKDSCNSSADDSHIRLYGNSETDRFYDPRYGYFVVGTTHRDHGDGCGGAGVTPYFGYSEMIEEHFADVFDNAGLSVWNDYVPLDNREFPQRYDVHAPDHVWSNDGNATVVRIP